MVFLQLFLTFLKIGLFTFGGGYAMIALIQSEVTINHHWLTPQEFTDILAVSQMTPGPVGINTATYTGYTAVLNAGYDTWLAVLGALLASLAVILLPMALMVVAVIFLKRMQGNKDVENIFRYLRKAVVGLIAAAALQLLSVDSFGQPALTMQFVLSLAIFAAVFVLSLRRVSPILLILGAGVLGIVAYAF
ncbi:MAG: chromate transporter [Bacteroidales bacterium]|nr:chromate transporter [Bacteroidales bacterium]